MTLTRAPIFLLCMCNLILGQLLRQTRVPIIPNKPFVTVWNAPTAACKSSFGIDLNLDIFDIISNQNDSFIGQSITIFYENKLGFYPHYTDSGVSVNGGTPQNSSLKYHLMKAKVDVEKLIPLEDFDGLSVIDWESWRPLWSRDWDQKDIYRRKSKQLVQKRHPDWSEKQVAKQAQIEYEHGAMGFMVQTLKLSKILRPLGLWGYYGFPCCYNDKFTKNYTGKCPGIEMKRNDQLAWLWKESIALYPSIYLNDWHRITQNTQRFVHYRIKEAMRHAEQGANYSLPVLPYIQVVYANTTDFLTETDLVHSIGESVAMGAAGIVLWGNEDYARSQCEKIISEELRAVPLHYCPELVEACADLINEEWKRSKASRIHSLQKSSNSFPVCLVLKKIPNDIGNTSSENRVQLVGHSRLSRVVCKSTGLFVETVVVAKEFRGKGYGRKLMEATEAYAKNRGFKTLYLTTHDKQDFYSHLGYVLTEPVQNAGSMTTFMNMEFLKKLSLPSVSTPINSHLLLPPGPSPQVPFPSPQLPTLPVSEPPQRHNHSSSSHPFRPSHSHVSVTLPSSFTALSSQSGQLPFSVPCSSNISQLDECVPIPPPPPLPPPLPSAHAGPPSLIMSQLHGQTHPCNSSPVPLTLPISQMSQLHSPLTLHLQLASPPADSVVMFPTPPPFLSASETLTKLAQNSPEFSKENEKATQNPLATPYRCVKGLPVFWMKKDL